MSLLGSSLHQLRIKATFLFPPSSVSVYFSFSFSGQRRLDFGWPQLLSCTLEVCKSCACPAVRLKKEPRVCDRDINDVMDEGAYYTSEARPWNDTPQCAVDGGQNVPAGFTLGGGNRKAISYKGN